MITWAAIRPLRRRACSNLPPLSASFSTIRRDKKSQVSRFSANLHVCPCHAYHTVSGNSTLNILEAMFYQFHIRHIRLHSSVVSASRGRRAQSRNPCAQTQREAASEHNRRVYCRFERTETGSGPNKAPITKRRVPTYRISSNRTL